jgi:hypothetical protein
MLVYRCATCSVSFGVPSTDAHLDLLGVVMRCSTEECPGRLQLGEGEPAQVVTAQQLFAAVRGFGTPEEKDCSTERLQRALVGRKIVAVEVTETGRKNRPVIKSIVLDDGVKAHFGSGSAGALIYKLTEGKQ